MPFDGYSEHNFTTVRRSWDFRGDKVKKLSRKRGGSIVDLVSKSKVVSTPTLVVSLGGLGGDTLNEVKKKFIRRVEPQIPGQEKVLFVEVDTDSNWLSRNEEKLSSDSAQGVMTQSEQVNIVFDTSPAGMGILNTAIHQEGIPQHEWVDKKLNPTLKIDSTGAHAIRQMGRLGLSVKGNYDHVYGMVENKLRILCANAPLDGHGAKLVNVILVAGISGGTGSGNIIDFSYMLHLIAKEIGAVNLSLDAILYTPDVQERVPDVVPDNLKRNFVACMKEIDNFFKADVTKEEYRFKSDRFHDGKVRDNNGSVIGDGMAIFNGVTLVQGYDANGQTLDISVPIETVSNYILSLLCEVDIAGHTLFSSILSNEIQAANRVLPLLNNQPRLPRDVYYSYRTIGYHEVEFPIEEIMTVVANHVLLAIHQEYQKEPSVTAEYVLKKIAKIYPFENCFESGKDNAEVINRLNSSSTIPNFDATEIKEYNFNNKVNSYPIGKYSYDKSWVKGIYETISNAIDDEFRKSGPYAALRLSQEICHIFEDALKVENQAKMKSDLNDRAEAYKSEAQRAHKTISEANWLKFILNKRLVNEQVDLFTTNLKDYTVMRWKLHVFDDFIQALKELCHDLVEQHNDVFNRYVGAFLAIQEVLQSDSLGIVQADFENNVFSTSLLNPKDMSNNNKRLFSLIGYFTGAEDISRLSSDFIESMLTKRQSWTSTSTNDFNAVNEFKKIFDDNFKKFKQNIIQRFMIIKYTGDDYSNSSVPIEELFEELDRLINDKANHPDPWGDFEQYCQDRCGVQPLHMAAEEILREALSIKYCAVAEDGMTAANIGFENFPKYNFLCLMKDTPDINRIILGDPQNGIPALPAYIAWQARSGGTSAVTADISSVICMQAVYILPLYIFKGFSNDQKIYYDAVTSGNPINAGLHMDSNPDRPWKDFPQIVNSDALRLLEDGKDDAMLREDYKYEISMLQTIKQNADNCMQDKNKMIDFEIPNADWYTLYYLNDSYKKEWEKNRETLLKTFEDDVNNAIDQIGDIDIRNPEEDWNKKFDELFVSKSLHERIKNAGYKMNSRDLHDASCYLGSAETDTGDLEDSNAASGGLYKVIRRSTKSRLTLETVSRLCDELNQELDKIRDELTTKARNQKIEDTKKEKARIELENEKNSNAEKLQLFFKTLIYGMLTIENDEEECDLRVIIDKRLCGGKRISFNYLDVPYIETDNLLYSVFVSSFLYLEQDNSKYWAQFESDLDNLDPKPNRAERMENYNKIKKYLPTDQKYYPRDEYRAEKALAELNKTVKANKHFEHFGDTKLTIDDLSDYSNAEKPFGFSIGSQLVRFYHDIKELARNARVSDN